MKVSISPRSDVGRVLVLNDPPGGKRKLNFLYLANDVMQNSRKKGVEWIDAFW
jgi:hypothetical protein